jgi:hypothetical protein
MKSLNTFVCITALGLMALATSYGKEEHARAPRQGSESIDAQTAVTRALEYGGFQLSRSFQPRGVDQMARLVAVEDSANEFIRDLLISRVVWSVMIDSILLDSKSKSAVSSDDMPQDFEVLIDPETGDLLKVSSEDEDFDHHAFTSGTWVGVHENQTPWREVVISTCQNAPEISLFSALKRITKRNPARAKAVIAYCLSYTWTGEFSRPILFRNLPDSVRTRRVWYIILKDYETQDHPEIQGTSSSIKNRQLFFHVIDAMTGEVILEGTVGERTSKDRKRHP